MRFPVRLTLVASCLLFAAGPLLAQTRPAPSRSGPAKAEFDRVFAQWKALERQVLSVRVQYQSASDADRPALEQQFNALIKKGEPLEQQLLQAAEKAYVEDPNHDRQITALMVDVLAKRIRGDDYEEARRLAEVLISHKCSDNRIYDMAGIAAFCLSDFDAAEKYLKQAQQVKMIDKLGEADLAGIPEYKRAWAREQKLREAEAKADDLPRVLLKTTKGDITVELFENEAPNTVANFISLVEKGFYSGSPFHRVLSGFMAQGGAEREDGSGGPGYTIADECYQPNRRVHFRGSLSMAKREQRDTGSSQFFLTFVPTGHLDGRHTVFGRVIEGMDVLAKIQRRDPASEGKLAPPDKIVEAKVLRKRSHEYLPRTRPEK